MCCLVQDLNIRMMKRMLLLMIFGIVTLMFHGCVEQRQTFTLSGKVTDFNGNSLDSVTVRLKDKTYKNLYETLTDKDGNYSLEVKKGDYYCLYAIKLSEYRVNRLEYWTWNVPVYEDMVINPQYDRMEIYGINVFEPQVTPQETYMIYFRPMSLSKTLQIAASQNVDDKEFQTAKRAEKVLESNNLKNMSPENIKPDELTVEVNGVKSEILGIDKITEYTRGLLLSGFIVQIKKPVNSKSQLSGYDFISITLNSKETGELGKGEAYVRKR